MKKVQEHPAQFLYRTGLLFEINRRVLHPLGLALSVDVDGDTNIATGFANLYDNRDDPEGIIFSKETFEESKTKLAEYDEDHSTDTALRLREKRLGFIVQEEP